MLIEVHPDPFVQLIDDLGQWLQLRSLLTAPTLARGGLGSHRGGVEHVGGGAWPGCF
jgi:hypothetical protein